MKLFQKKDPPKEDRSVSAALAAEEYGSGPAPVDEKVEELDASPFDEKTGVEIYYDLKSDEVKKGLLILQKEQTFKRSIIYTVILGVLFCVYVYYVIRDPSFTMGYFMLALAAGVMVVIWMMMWKFRTSQAKAVSRVTEDFNMTVYDTGILVHQENGDFRALYTEPKFHIRELDDLFLLDLNRQRVYILPKRRMTEEQVSALQKYFENNIIRNEKSVKAKKPEQED